MTARSEDVLTDLTFPVPKIVLGLAPAAEPDTDFWWHGPDDVLRVTTCADCGYLTHPPGPVCGRCRSRNVAPQPVSGRASLYTWTVNVQPFIPGLAPYCLGIVTLAEQDDVKVTTQLVDLAYADLRVGLPLEVVFVPGMGETRVPLFRPVR